MPIKHIALFCTLLFCTRADAGNFWSRANGVWTSTTVTWSNASCGGALVALAPVAGDNVTICAGHTVTISANAACANLTIQSGGILMTSGYFTLTISGNCDVQSGGTINLNGKGSARDAGTSIGTAAAGFYSAGGGGHGGFGGNAYSNKPNTGGVVEYGSILQPVTLGSGGGTSTSSASNGFGGAGGGAIKLDVTGILTVSGSITADGMVGTYNSTNGCGGGGAGGSLWLVAGTLAGNGTITANGGVGALGGGYYGGGGGGGRIAYYYTTKTFSGTVTAYGGASGAAGGWAGGCGTVYEKPSASNGRLHYINSSPTNNADSPFNLTEAATYDTVFVGGKSSLKITGAQTAVVNNLNVTANCDVYGSTTSFTVANDFIMTSTSTGMVWPLLTTLTVSHDFTMSGTMVCAVLTSLNVSHDYILSGSQTTVALAGFNVTNDLNVSGDMTTSSATAALTVGRDFLITGTGSLISSTTGTTTSSVTRHFTINNGGIFTWPSSTTLNIGNAGVGDLNINTGGAFTMSRLNTMTISNDLIMNGTLNTYSLTTLNITRDLSVAGSMSVTAAASTTTTTITVSRNVTISTGGTLLGTYVKLILPSGNCDVQSGGKISTDAWGSAKESGSNPGGNIGGGGANNKGAGGGGYGGFGGNANLNNSEGVGGVINYGSISQPAILGSGGGSSLDAMGDGGAGGGAIKLDVSGTLTINGLVTANGEVGGDGCSLCGNPGGAGSGGSIWIIANTLAGTYSITANGGNGKSFGGYSSGGGGGGRIAYYYTTLTGSGVITAFGGAYGNTRSNYGGAGTVYEKPPGVNGRLHLINNSSANGYEAETPLDMTVSITFDTIYVSSHSILKMTGVQTTVVTNLNVATTCRIYGSTTTALTVSNDYYMAAVACCNPTESMGPKGMIWHTLTSLTVNRDYFMSGLQTTTALATFHVVRNLVLSGVMTTSVTTAALTVDNDATVSGSMTSQATAGGTTTVAVAHDFTISNTGTFTWPTSTTLTVGRDFTIDPPSSGSGVIMTKVNSILAGRNATINGVLTTTAATTYTVTNDLSMASTGTITLGTNATTTVTTRVYNNATIAGVIQASTLWLLVTNNLNVQAGGKINTSAFGYSRTTPGPAAGTDWATNGGGGGGGYGGRGGYGYRTGSNTGVGGSPTYGVSTSPSRMGSNGGGSASYAGGSGGGALQLKVGGTFTADGSVTANGANGTNCSGCGQAATGAGSGGSIWACVNIWAGAGTISATGGNGNTDGGYCSGMGGGGRIAISYNSKTFSGATPSVITGTAVSNCNTYSVALAGTYVESTPSGCFLSPFLSVPLPVTLLKFSAQLNKNEVALLWNTSAEINNDYFTVERNKINEIDAWENIGTVKGAGTSSSLNQYSLMDNELPPQTTLYYRLKQTDFNGQYEYFGPIAVNLEADEEINIHTDATNEQLVVSFPQKLEGKNCTVKIYDISGRVCFSTAFVPAEYKRDVRINLDLSPGVYIVSASSDSGISLRKKFVRSGL